MECNSPSTRKFYTCRNVDVYGWKWKVKSVFAALIYCLLMVFYLPFFMLGAFKLGKMILVMKMKRALGMQQGNEKGRLGIASRKHKVTDMAAVNSADELDFLVNRSFGYICRMCLWTPMELALFFLKEQKIKLISDSQLVYCVLCTVFGHSVTWNKTRNMFRLEMDGLEDIQLFEGFYWEAREILISEDGKKIIIKMEGGEEFHSDCAPEDRPTFDLAKLHAQVCLSYMGPGLSHNHVHFLFPSTMAVLSKEHLDHEGVLFKLLSPHFRFTERINYQALHVQKATNNKRSTFDRLFFFWQPFPVIKEVFREAVAKKCKEHYLVKGQVPCEEDFESSSEEDNAVEVAREKNGLETTVERNGHSHVHDTEKKHKGCKRRTHTLFPPDFVSNKSLRKVPYLFFLNQYYKVIRNYVEDLVPFIDREEWERLSTEVAKIVPRFDKAGMVDAIASYILKVGVVHFCDHRSYVRYFSYEYACMSMRTPFEPFSNTEAWTQFQCETKVEVEAAMRDPIALIRQRDVLRTRSFLNIFVDFIDNPKCNLFLCDTEYGFDGTGPQMAEERFKKALRNLDDKLKMQRNIVSTPEPLDGEERGDGMQLIALNEIIRTVCY